MLYGLTGNKSTVLSRSDHNRTQKQTNKWSTGSELGHRYDYLIPIERN